MPAVACVKKTLAVVVFGVVFSGSAFADESFGIMNDRLSSAMQDNANNNNIGTQARVHDAYNAAKGAIGGSMDNSKALSSTPAASFSTTDPRTSLSAPNLTHAQADQINNAFGQSYIDAKNETSVRTVAPDTMTPGNKVDPTGNPVSMVAGVKNDPTGTPVSMVEEVKNNSVTTAPDIKVDTGVTAVTQTAPIPDSTPVTLSNTVANSTINVDANQLAANTPVQVGDVITTAGAIAATNPTAQISVPMESVFTTPSRSNHNNRERSVDHQEHQGRGADNEHSHAFGGHGYGHDNSKSKGFGGHAQFH